MMTKDKRNKKDGEREEFGNDLSPDDLDVREDNDLTKEQFKNANEKNEKQEENQ
ncbi:hypothetical protein ACQKNX_23810 [Lysinibacillus sp. NPDC093712]|uniref:hypothetical protein n=1 Tax=Lysinibacillus sp. NPDC093712 TaxID=3390579 RepID=UPI003D03D2B9